TFVLTVGATANQNGTALYEGLTVLFLAQLAGVDLTLGQQVLVAYLAILGGIGTAGVPSGSIPFIIVVLTTDCRESIFDRAHSGRGPDLRYVPDNAQCHGRHYGRHIRRPVRRIQAA